MNIDKINVPYRIFMYYFLFHRASNVIMLYDPCQVKGNDICIAGRFCCSGCKYLSPAGCITKSLTCRYSLCGDAWHINPTATDKLQEVRRMDNRIFGNTTIARENCSDMLKYIQQMKLGGGF
jgi:hypothetical protein